MRFRRSLLGLGIALAMVGMSLQGCRSPALRYSISSVEDGEHSPSEIDRILAKEVERLSPTFLDKPLKAMHVVAPDYPKWVSRRHSGSVLVRFTIQPQGTVTSMTPRSEDNPELVKLVTEALGSWRFEPPTRGGQPASVNMTLPFRFVVSH